MLNKIIKYGLYLYVFLLPWQTRWIYKNFLIKGEVWEYNRWSLYGTEIILLVILLLGLIDWIIQFKKLNKAERREAIRNDSRGIRFLIFLLGLWSVLSILWAKDQGLAWYGWIKLMEGIGFYWLITNKSLINRESVIANKSRISLTSIGNILIASGVVQALFGIGQFLRQKDFIANKWLGLSAMDITEPGASVIEFLDQRWVRAYGGLPHPNILGGFLAICLLVLIINLWQHNQKVTDFRQASYLNIYYWLSAIIIFTGLVLTFSRAAWLAFGISFGLGFIYHLIKKTKIINKLNFALIIMFCLVFGLIWTTFPTQLFTTRFNFEARLEKRSLSERALSYQQADSLSQEHWFRGLGINNYTVALERQEPNQSAWYYQPVHNSWYLVLVESGWPGLLLYIFIVLAAIRKRNKYLLLILAMIILAGLDHYFASLYFGIMLWWLIIGLSVKSIKSNE